MSMLVWRLLAARTSQKSETTGSYYTTLVYHDLSSREHTGKVDEGGVLKVDVVRFSKYVLQGQV